MDKIHEFEEFRHVFLDLHLHIRYTDDIGGGFMQENICLFVPNHKEYQAIQTIHYVKESRPQVYDTLKSLSLYRIYYVCTGTGLLHTAGRTDPLSEGDVFLTFPGIPFCIESVSDFTYLYIGFLGARGNQIMERLKISPRNFLFRDCLAIGDLWKQGLATPQDLTDLMSESVLLHTFAFLGSRTLPENRKSSPGSDACQIIKKYIDDRFSDPALSLERIGSDLQYNQKYISSIFKKNMGVGISVYLNQIRIQHACTLIRQGFTGVSDIAARCGFSDPQYFSRVFKEKIGIPPGQYIRQHT